MLHTAHVSIAHRVTSSTAPAARPAASAIARNWQRLRHLRVSRVVGEELLDAALFLGTSMDPPGRRRNDEDTGEFVIPTRMRAA